MGDILSRMADETGLVERARGGDLTAVAAVMQRNNHALWRIARVILMNEFEAEYAV